MIYKKEMAEKFEQIKEIMKDYTDVCKLEGCSECPFIKTVGYIWEGCEVSFCDAIDKILEK
jgi:hypothetical protein